LRGKLHVATSTQPARLEYFRPWQARLVLVGAVLLAAAGVAATLSPARSGFADKAQNDKPGDVALYNAEIQRMRSGEGYYEAADLELRARGYPTASVFNWRTPLPMWLIARLPESGGKVLVGILAILLMGCGARLLAREGGLAQGGLCGILLFGAVMPVFLADLYAMPVLWSGVLIGLSVCAYGHGRWGWGVIAGLAALFCRDLAAPYCLASAAWAVWRRRWAEALAWLVALAAYAVFFALHALLVARHMQPGDMAHAQGWLRLGGLPFVISLVQVNAYLLISPQWLSALYLPTALLGLAAWPSPFGGRVKGALCLYLLVFAIVGQPFNQYWGAMMAPLLCFGAARFPWSVKQAMAACMQPRAAARLADAA
jgi:hypothetical protein